MRASLSFSAPGWRSLVVFERVGMFDIRLVRHTCSDAVFTVSCGISGVARSASS